MLKSAFVLSNGFLVRQFAAYGAPLGDALLFVSACIGFAAAEATEAPGVPVLPASSLGGFSHGGAQSTIRA